MEQLWIKKLKPNASIRKILSKYNLLTGFAVTGSCLAGFFLLVIAAARWLKPIVPDINPKSFGTVMAGLFMAAWEIAIIIWARSRYSLEITMKDQKLLAAVLFKTAMLLIGPGIALYYIVATRISDEWFLVILCIALSALSGWSINHTLWGQAKKQMLDFQMAIPRGWKRMVDDTGMLIFKPDSGDDWRISIQKDWAVKGLTDHYEKEKESLWSEPNTVFKSGTEKVESVGPYQAYWVQFEMLDHKMEPNRVGKKVCFIVADSFYKITFDALPDVYVRELPTFESVMKSISPRQHAI